MGFACVKSNDAFEDKGAQNILNKAVGANSISDDQLDQLDFSDGLSQRLMLSFKGVDLPNLDTASKTDAFCILWEIKGKQKMKRGQTECVLDNLNPEFVTTIDVAYQFEENQKFLLEVYDADDMNQLQNLSKQELVGNVTFTLHQIVTKAGQTNTFQLANPVLNKPPGKMKVTAVEKKADYGQTECQFTVTITNPAYRQNDSLFFILFASQVNGTGGKPVYKSEN